MLIYRSRLYFYYISSKTNTEIMKDLKFFLLFLFFLFIEKFKTFPNPNHPLLWGSDTFIPKRDNPSAPISILTPLNDSVEINSLPNGAFYLTFTDSDNTSGTLIYNSDGSNYISQYTLYYLIEQFSTQPHFLIIL